MALVTSLERGDSPAGSPHRTNLVAKYRVSGSGDGRLFQLDTHGSPDRKIPGKLSQTLQFGPEAAHQLYLALKAEFGFRD